jgi:hypothetical protein
MRCRRCTLLCSGDIFGQGVIGHNWSGCRPQIASTAAAADLALPADSAARRVSFGARRHRPCRHPTARDPAHAPTIRPGPSCPLGRPGTSGGHEADRRSSRWQGGSYPAGPGPVGPMPFAQQPLRERRSDEQQTMGDLRYDAYRPGSADESMPVYGPDDRGSRAIHH